MTPPTEHSKPLVTHLKKIEIQELHDKEFRIIILRMLRELQDLMKLGKQYTNKMRTSTKYVENIKKN